MSIYFKGTKFTSSGVSDYSQLTGKPSINGKMLVGDISVGSVVEVVNLPTSGISQTTLYKKGNDLYWHDGTDWVQLNKKASAASGDIPTGTIVPFIGLVAPDGWLLCEGQAISRTAYSDLYQMVGTTYGSGDGSTTFNIPDLRGRFIEGASSTTGHTLHSKVAAGIPTHKHAFTGTAISGYIDLGGGDSGDWYGDYSKAAKDSNGVLKYTDSGKTYQYTGLGSVSPKRAIARLNFNATPKGTIDVPTGTYSAVYKSDCATVQPASICTNYIIRC